MVLEVYISKIAPCLVVAQASGEIGGSTGAYHVYYPDTSHVKMNWREFQNRYRPITRHERKLLDMTDAESQVAMISDN